jgi:hypothetical protein
MRGLIKLTIVFMAFLGNCTDAQAQLILTGCTAFLSSSPQPSNLVDIDIMTGIASNPRNIGISVMAGIAAHPTTGEIFGLTTFASTPVSALVRIDRLTGSPTLVGFTGLTLLAEGDLAFNPINGLLYGIQDGGATESMRNLFILDQSTGVASVLGSLNTQGDYSALAFRNDGTLFAIDDGPSGNSLLHTVNPVNGQITNTTSLNFHLGSGVGMAFDPITGIPFVADGGGGATNLLYSLEVSTGMLTPIGNTGSLGLSGLTFVSVPEPSSIAFLSVPVCIAGFRCIKRKTRN